MIWPLTSFNFLYIVKPRDRKKIPKDITAAMQAWKIKWFATEMRKFTLRMRRPESTARWRWHQVRHQHAL